MATGDRSTWPLVLLLGLCASLLLGSAVAVAQTPDSERPWWRDDDPQWITGTVVTVDAETGSVVLDELLSYDADRQAVGTLTITVPDIEPTAVGETVDVQVTRSNGRWTAAELVLLDTD